MLLRAKVTMDSIPNRRLKMSLGFTPGISHIASSSGSMLVTGNRLITRDLNTTGDKVNNNRSFFTYEIAIPQYWTFQIKIILFG